MDVSNESMVMLLNRLLRTLYDSQQGFKASAGHIKGSFLVKTLTDYSDQRGKFANELIDEIIKYCGSPVAPDGIVQNVKRGWQSLTEVLANKDEKAILEECLKGDEAALDQYEMILTDSLPPMIKSMLLKHHEGIRQSVNRLKVLKKTAEHGA